MRHSFKVMHDELHGKDQNIPVGGRWVGEKTWHESQKIRKLPDGSLEISFRVAGLDEIKRWSLSFAPKPPSWTPQTCRSRLEGIWAKPWLKMSLSERR
jgi:hypothetical protein